MSLSYVEFEHRLQLLESQLGLLVDDDAGNDLLSGGDHAVDSTNADDDDDVTAEEKTTPLLRLQLPAAAVLLPSSISLEGSNNALAARITKLERTLSSLLLGSTSSSSADSSSITASGTTQQQVPPSGGGGTTSSSLKTTLKECMEMLMMESSTTGNNFLDPGTALTHGKQIVAPILYRKQELLSYADDLSNQFEQVKEIRDLLSIGQTDKMSPTSSSQSNKKGSSSTGTATQDNIIKQIDERYVTEAPILVDVVGVVAAAGGSGGGGGGGGNNSSDDKQQLAAGKYRGGTNTTNLLLSDLEKAVANVSDRTDATALKIEYIVEAQSRLLSAISERTIVLDELLLRRRRGGGV